jgi:hypothetical protein
MSQTVNIQIVYAAPLRSVLRKAVAGFNDQSPQQRDALHALNIVPPILVSVVYQYISIYLI